MKDLNYMIRPLQQNSERQVNKMKVALISFSRNGAELSEKIADFLSKSAHEVTSAVKSVYVENSIEESAKTWTEKQFHTQDAIIFIGAAGIAVRSIAPMVASKCIDPAVLVIDEKGKYCIPILSGHIGGANALAQIIGEAFSMEAVITTATDVQGKWAVDVFAIKNHLQIKEMKKAKEISARILAGEKVCYCIEGAQVNGRVPEELFLMEQAEEKEEEPDIYTGIYRHPNWTKPLHLIPKVVVAGIGCKKGTSMETIEHVAEQVLEKEGICRDALKMVASIDLKAEEKGLLDYCEKYHLDFQTYGSAELLEVEGEFTGSDFVKKITGVENICERSALRASKGGKLISRKYAQDGVTVAFAVQKWEVTFE